MISLGAAFLDIYSGRAAQQCQHTHKCPPKRAHFQHASMNNKEERGMHIPCMFLYPCVQKRVGREVSKRDFIVSANGVLGISGEVYMPSYIITIAGPVERTAFFHFTLRRKTLLAPTSRRKGEEKKASGNNKIFFCLWGPSLNSTIHTQDDRLAGLAPSFP